MAANVHTLIMRVCSHLEPAGPPHGCCPLRVLLCLRAWLLQLEQEPLELLEQLRLLRLGLPTLVPLEPLVDLHAKILSGRWLSTVLAWGSCLRFPQHLLLQM